MSSSGVADWVAPRVSLSQRAIASHPDDPVLNALGAALRASLRLPQVVSGLYFEHLTLAIQAHLRRGRVAPSVTDARLSTQQQRRIQRLVAARLTGPISLQELARECGMSSGHFSRAFKATIGQTPHQWLIDRRVEHAKRLLRGKTSLTEIASACGFSDLSHFSRVFAQRTGLAPSAWRRAAT